MPLLHSNGSDLSRKLATQTVGHWLPRDKKVILGWACHKARQARKHNAPLNPSLQAFSAFIKNNPTLNQLGESMWTEVPASYYCGEDPTGHPEIRDFDTFIQTVNTILVTGPEFYDIKGQSVQAENAMGLIGFPINAILDWPMGTQSGWLFWYDSEVNKHFQPVLQAFTHFLGSKASRKVLKAPSGWVGQDAQHLLATKGNDGVTKYSFTQLYQCPDPSDAEYLGFNSWDHFFTRRFKRNIRPVAEPDNNSILNNSCESAPLQYTKNVKAIDNFMLKGQPYSLMNMLNSHAGYAQQFIGGSVFQAFLSALSYHRWNSPVNGTVLDTINVPGTYYSENPYQGFPNPDPSAPNNSQPYISSVATRGIIYIQADGPIGLMAIVYIGMAEVSSCEFTVRKKQRIRKGDELGMFHFGGSSHCMVFRPGVELVFNEPSPGPPRQDGTWDQTNEQNLPVNGPLAYVTTAS
ncbi:Phophatidylserine decarboxylase-domain-containing protein [Microdochium bolleyi]|uniref:Phophatidylserine decarboxylase-domain-containing protein n=1 Tax=Microdochium bolleyi TaxID=196109 RepID=A0A136JH80_9PEZI|nr:Phophatidylserine decarboxylase-domain-containing protein [Microdochium bolleyi]